MSGSAGGKIEVWEYNWIEGVQGSKVAELDVPYTGGWGVWETRTVPLKINVFSNSLKLKYTGAGGYLLNVNWFQFVD